MIDIKIEEIKLEDLKMYENNPRINDKGVKYVADSIKKFGFLVPLVIDKDNVIVCGHTRYLASKELNLKTVPCIRAENLTDKQIKAFRIADNKIHEKSSWDNELLKEELAELQHCGFNLEDLGFLEFELDCLFDEEIDIEDLENENKQMDEKVCVKLTFDTVKHFKKYDSEIHKIAEEMDVEVSVKYI